MKKRPWILAVAAFFLIVFAAKGIGWYRWSSKTSEEKATLITEKMAKRFSLDEAQKQKIYALNLQKIADFEAARASGQKPRESWKGIRASWKAEVRTVLTPAQQEKFCQ